MTARMATSGHARKTALPNPTSTALRNGQVRSSSPPAISTRPPGFRIGGGIRVVRSADGSKTSSQEHTASSDPGPTPLYRRILYPGVNDIPPRILATPGTEQVDVQLYTLLALICRGFIAPWYSKISRDRAFNLEIVRVTSHVFRQLELRLVDNHGQEDARDTHLDAKKVDKIRFIFDTLPRILERHIQDFNTAKARSKSAYSAGVHGHNGLSNLEVYFHSIQAHAAINLSPPSKTSSDERLPQNINADYLRAVIDALLEQLLPKEDSSAETEHSVVCEVIVGIVLDGIFRKVAQPWFIYGLIAKQLERRTANSENPVFQVANESKPNSGVSSHYTLSAPQEWWLKLATFVVKLPVFFSQLVALFGYLSWLFTTSFASPYYKSYTRSPGHVCNITYSWSSFVMTALRSEDQGRHTISQLGRTAQNIASAGSPLLDRIIVRYLYSRIFTASFTCKLLESVQESLFPDGFPAASVPDPTPQEQVAIRDRALQAIANNLPNAAALKLLVRREEDDDVKVSLAADILEPFSSHYINLHLCLFVLDTIVAEVCPDLVVQI